MSLFYAYFDWFYSSKSSFSLNVFFFWKILGSSWLSADWTTRFLSEEKDIQNPLPELAGWSLAVYGRSLGKGLRPGVKRHRQKMSFTKRFLEDFVKSKTFIMPYILRGNTEIFCIPCKIVMRLTRSTIIREPCVFVEVYIYRKIYSYCNNEKLLEI